MKCHKKYQQKMWYNLNTSYETTFIIEFYYELKVVEQFYDLILTSAIKSTINIEQFLFRVVFFYSKLNLFYVFISNFKSFI